MPRIKILYIITRMIPGGAARIVLSLCKNLDKNKYDIVLLYGQDGSIHDLKEELADCNIKFIIIPELRRNINIIKDAVALIKIYLFIKRERFDIVHTHTSKAGVLGRFAARLAGAPVVVHTPHGHIFMPGASINGVSENRLKMNSLLLIERFLSFFSDRIISLSNDEKKAEIKLKIAKPDKFVTIYNGIDAQECSQLKMDVSKTKEGLGIPLDYAVLGTIGRLEPEKGQRYFIEAAKLVLEKMPKVKFLIIGEGTLKKELQDYAAKLGIVDCITFLGLRKDIYTLLSIMDIFVLPSLYEGFGIAILEAMSACLPVVASNVGGIPEVIVDGQTGFLVKPANPKDLADKILLLLNNKDMRLAIGQRARKRVEDFFDLKMMTKDTECLYEQLSKAKIRK